MDSDIPEAIRLAHTLETWWPAVEAFLTTGITNARTEGTNRLAKDVARRACGFRNPDNHQRRVRLHCTCAFRCFPRRVGHRRPPYSADVPLLAADATIVSTPIVVVFLIFQRDFIWGMVGGAIRG